jgi:endonuclease/exonuclease/phosphatase family metal-dependent hydrolase
MTAPARRLRSRSLLAVESALAALLLAGAAVVGGGGAGGGGSDGDGTARDIATEDAQLTVMTQNLYVGTGPGLRDAFGAASDEELVAAGTHAWADLLASDFRIRAGALADDMAQLRPDVVGLQEVTLWRDQTPGDVLTRRAPDATHVAIDFLAVLREELSARGVPYTAVATSTNADVEFPRLDAAAGLVDLRLTDRDVLLVRADEADRFGDPRAGHYAAQSGEPFLTGPFTSTRGWTSVDYRPDPRTTVRILSTHLEVGGAVTGTTQEQQAAEFLALVAASPHPVIALGDFNSPADGSTTPTYRTLTTVLHDAWTSARPADPGWTCCQPASLADPLGRETARLDLVLTSADLRVDRVARTGDRPFRTAPPPLWRSDHVGVTAAIGVPRR